MGSSAREIKKKLGKAVGRMRRKGLLSEVQGGEKRERIVIGTAIKRMKKGERGKFRDKQRNREGTEARDRKEMGV